MRRPDIVIVKPGSQRQLYQDLGAFELTAIEPPLWGALLGGYLRHKGFAVALLDAEVDNLSYQETARVLVDLSPRLVLISVSGTNPSASTMNMTGAGAILDHLKSERPEQPTIITGLHVTALPEQTMREEKTDFVCVGEGFHTLPPLLEHLEHGGDPKQIPGLVFRNASGANQFGPQAPLLENLGELPMPAWDLLPMEKYRAHNWHCFGDIENRSPYGVVYTSLGCPFKCTFCCINALFGKSGIRLRPPEQVLDEIDFLVSRFGIRNIKIIDEMFAFNIRHVNAICDGIVERGHALNIWAYARVNTVNATMLAKMKRAGINWVAYGFESGSEKVLSGVSKGYATKGALEVARMTYDEGLYINGNYIFGLPDDDLDTMTETLEMAEQINSEWVNLYAAMAYPGSKLHETAKSEGLPLPQSWADYSQYGYDSTPLSTKHLSGKAVLAFRDAAFDRYYKRTGYLEMISKKFGDATRAHIETMTANKLPRRP